RARAASARPGARDVGAHRGSRPRHQAAGGGAQAVRGGARGLPRGAASGGARRGAVGRVAGAGRPGAVRPCWPVRCLPPHRDARPLAQCQPLAPLPRGSRRPGAGCAAAAFPVAQGPLGAGDAVTVWLDFEKPLVELENKIRELRENPAERGPGARAELEDLERKAERLRAEIYASLTRYQRVQLARHPRRPYALDYIERCFTGFMELHGDRLFGEDRAIVAGLALLEERPVMVIGQQEGRDTRQNLLRRFGMPNPEGYRQA